jgi:hypothetical protein
MTRRMKDVDRSITARPGHGSLGGWEEEKTTVSKIFEIFSLGSKYQLFA